MIIIRDVLNEKGSVIFFVSPDYTVYTALEIMSANNIGSVLVIENEKLVGIFSERDYLNKVILVGLSSKTTAVRDIMSTNLVYVSPTDSIDQAMAIMTEMHCRHLPVINNGQIVGIVSIGDLVKKKIVDLNAKITHLSDYIFS